MYIVVLGKPQGVLEGKSARIYEENIKKNADKFGVFNEFILSNINNIESAKICDLCCGSGRIIELLRKAKEIVGVDASSEMIAISQEKFQEKKNIKLLLSSVDNTGLKSGYFDYITISFGLHHIKDKRSVISEMYRLLKPEGKIIIIDNIF